MLHRSRARTSGPSRGYLPPLVIRVFGAHCPVLARKRSSGHAAAAGIDVYMEEPLPPGHPLTELDNVVLTPHSAYNTPEAGAAILDMAIADLEAFYAGTPTNLVTP